MGRGSNLICFLFFNSQMIKKFNDLVIHSILPPNALKFGDPNTDTHEGVFHYSVTSAGKSILHSPIKLSR